MIFQKSIHMLCSNNWTDLIVCLPLVFEILGNTVKNSIKRLYSSLNFKCLAGRVLKRSVSLSDFSKIKEYYYFLQIYGLLMDYKVTFWIKVTFK